MKPPWYNIICVSITPTHYWTEELIALTQWDLHIFSLIKWQGFWMSFLGSVDVQSANYVQCHLHSVYVIHVSVDDHETVQFMTTHVEHHINFIFREALYVLHKWNDKYCYKAWKLLSKKTELANKINNTHLV